MPHASGPERFQPIVADGENLIEIYRDFYPTRAPPVSEPPETPPTAVPWHQFATVERHTGSIRSGAGEDEVSSLRDAHFAGQASTESGMGAVSCMRTSTKSGITCGC
jgi:hypothetical protein